MHGILSKVLGEDDVEPARVGARSDRNTISRLPARKRRDSFRLAHQSRMALKSCRVQHFVQAHIVPIAASQACEDQSRKRSEHTQCYKRLVNAVNEQVRI